MKALLAFALLGALLLAGCAGTSKTDSSSDSTGSSSVAGSASGSKATSSSTGTTSSPGTSAGSSSGASEANKAPAISEFSVNNATGVAPLQVAFSFNATDANKDALTYSLSFGDESANATGSLPSAVVTHSFAAAGNYTAKLVVSDGKATANKTLIVQVAAGGAAGSGARQAVDLSWVASGGTRTFPLEYGDCADGPMVGVTMDSFVLDQATAGRPFTATITGDTAPVDWFIIFSLPDCSADLERFTATGAASITGIVPSGAHDYMMVASNGGANLEVHYETA
ncbi:MAG: PKD domain-containing protein [Candidatus Thermoplasmatota archaeon]